MHVPVGNVDDAGVRLLQYISAGPQVPQGFGEPNLRCFVVLPHSPLGCFSAVGQIYTRYSTEMTHPLYLLQDFGVGQWHLHRAHILSLHNRGVWPYRRDNHNVPQLENIRSLLCWRFLHGAGVYYL